MISQHTDWATLDLLITEINSQIQIDKCWASPFISDHCTIKASLSISRSDLIKKHIAYRRHKDIQPEVIAKDFDKLTSEIMEAETPNLDELVDICEHKLKAILDNHAPMKERSVTRRHTVPWFTTEIITQKRKVQRREKTWHKYGQDHQWQALKIECSKYKSMLKATKKATLNEKIIECGRDSKKLYKFVSIITGTSKINPMPTASSDEQLENEFAEFFYWQNQQN